MQLKGLRPILIFLKKNQISSDKPLVALLPGSRKQEVSKILDKMLSIRDDFSGYQFVIAGVSNLPKELYEPFEQMENVAVIYDQTYDLLRVAEGAIVTSGTATLETALFGLPQVVVYKTSALTFWVAMLLVKVDYISLVNLVADKEAVKELIQGNFNPEMLKKELQAILPEGKKREKVLADYQELRAKMGQAGASEKAGKMMVAYLKDCKKEEKVI